VVSWFHELPDTSAAGGKGANLSRMAREGLPVPPGFVVCAPAFAQFIDGGIFQTIAATVADLDVYDDEALDQAAEAIRGAIATATMPTNLSDAIATAYEAMGDHTRVAVRSSAIGEDGETASFAGQQETFLNLRGADAVLQAVRDCWASFFSPRAMFYRAEKGDITDTRMAVVVQEMVLADRSGVLFTVDPVHKTREHMVMEAVFGLGEGIVSGMITPAHYVVERTTGEVIRDFVPRQALAVVHAPEGGTMEVHLSEEQTAHRVLEPTDLEALRKVGLQVEAIFGPPQDIEWCLRDGQLFVLQSRPITNL
jgi:phosphoenolpyruvate synthase/pyruvate phosphate dikinase